MARARAEKHTQHAVHCAAAHTRALTHSLISICHTCFTSVLILSKIINFKGEINLFTSFSLSVFKAHSFQLTNKRPLVLTLLFHSFHLVLYFFLFFCLCRLFCFSLTAFCSE